MDLATIVADVKDECNKRTLEESVIKRRIAYTLNFTERAHDFKYLEKFGTFTVDPNAAEPRRLEQPSNLRAVNFMRVALDTGKYQKIIEVNPNDVVSNDGGYAKGYWASGTEYWWLDRTPVGEYGIEYGYEQFTTFLDEDTFEPWLFTHAPDYVFHQTVMYLSSYLREPTLYKLHKPMRDEALNTVLTLNEELKYSNQQMRMGGYGSS